MSFVFIGRNCIKLITEFYIKFVWCFVTCYFCQKTWYKCLILTYVDIGIRKHHWCPQETVIHVPKMFMYVSVCVNCEKYKISVKMKVQLPFVCRYVPMPHSRLRNLHGLNRGISRASSVKLATICLTTGTVPKSVIYIKQKIIYVQLCPDFWERIPFSLPLQNSYSFPSDKSSIYSKIIVGYWWNDNDEVYPSPIVCTTNIT